MRPEAAPSQDHAGAGRTAPDRYGRVFKGSHLWGAPFLAFCLAAVAGAIVVIIDWPRSAPSPLATGVFCIAWAATGVGLLARHRRRASHMAFRREPFEAAARASRLLVVGDSHSCFWGGENSVKNGVFASKAFAGMDIFHLGPITAHGISTISPPHRELNTLRSYLAAHKAKYGCIVFSFGEIDCRCHIVRLAAESDIDIKALAQKTARQYFKFVERIVRDFDIVGIIWAPIPSSPPHKFLFNADYPAIGSIVERNYATYVFSQTLAELTCGSGTISFMSAFDDLIDDAFVTKADYLYDGCHLSSIYLRQATAKLRQSVIGLKAYYLLDSIAAVWPIAAKTHLRNVASGQPYTVSSVWGDHVVQPFEDAPLGAIRFHTDAEDAPHIVIALDSAYWIERIVAHNRSREFQERARSLAVALSNDDVDYEIVFKPMEEEWIAFGAAAEALTIDVKASKPYRFVKLYLQERTYFHLECVQVYARSFSD